MSSPIERRDFRDGIDVHEVDDLRDVRLAEPERLRIAVDRDHAQAEVLRAPNRAPLVPPSADEQNRSFHGGRL